MEPAAAPARTGGGARRFAITLALIAFTALTLRVVYIVAVTQGDPHTYDATYYELEARSITHGDGFFVDPFPLFEHPPRHVESADHPPLTVLALLPASLVEGPNASEFAMRLTMALVGTAVVVLIGLVTRGLAGSTAGLVAAGIAALDPNLWMNDGLIMSEALAALLTIAMVWCVYRVLRRGGSWWMTIGLGVLAGVGILARAEGIFYLPFLVLPALWIGARGDHRRAFATMATAVGVAALVLAPWVGFNLTRFEKFTPISTNDGLTLRAAYCDNSFYGPRVGFADVFPPCSRARDFLDQSVWNAGNRHDAIEYIKDHLDRVPVVALARLGRAWNVFNVGQSAEFASFEGRPEWASYLGAVFTWFAVPLAAFGAVLLRRRRRSVWPLVVPIVVATFTIAFIAGGLLRYRAPAEPALVVLAAVGVLGLFARHRLPEPADARSAGAGGDDRGLVSAGPTASS